VPAARPWNPPVAAPVIAEPTAPALNGRGIHPRAEPMRSWGVCRDYETIHLPLRTRPPPLHARQLAAMALKATDKAFWLRLAEDWLKLADQASALVSATLRRLDRRRLYR